MLKIKDIILASVCASFITAPALAGSSLPITGKGSPVSGGGGGDQTDALFAGQPAKKWMDAGAFHPTNSTLNSVAFCAVHSASCTGGQLGNSGINALMNKWDSAGYDGTNSILFIAGGGHNDLSDSEINIFQLSDLEFHNLSAPNPSTIGSNYAVNSTCGGSSGDGINADNTNLGFSPAPHSGGSLVVVNGKLIIITNGCRDGHTYSFNPAANSPGVAGVFTQGDVPLTGLTFYEKAVLNTVDGKIYTHNCKECNGFPPDTRIQVYDPAASLGAQWAAWTNGSNTLNGASAMGYGYGLYENDVFVPSGWLIGFGDSGTPGGGPNTWGQIVDLTTGTFQYVPAANVSGNTTCGGVTAPGVAYNAKNGKVYVWCGGQALYELTWAFGTGGNAPLNTNFGGTMTLTAVAGITGATPACSDAPGAGNCTSSTGYQQTGTWSRFFCDYKHGANGLCGVVNSNVDDVFMIEF